MARPEPEAKPVAQPAPVAKPEPVEETKVVDPPSKLQGKLPSLGGDNPLNKQSAALPSIGQTASQGAPIQKKQTTQEEREERAKRLRAQRDKILKAK